MKDEKKGVFGHDKDFGFREDRVKLTSRFRELDDQSVGLSETKKPNTTDKLVFRTFN